MKKSIAVIISCIISVFVFQVCTTVQKANFQNLQILPQDISKDGLVSIMKHFTASLDVNCEFCHVKNIELDKIEYARDDKPQKHIAREMLLMTLDINKNHFQATKEKSDEEEKVSPVKESKDHVEYLLKYASCYTCHQGVKQPVNMPPSEK